MKSKSFPFYLSIAALFVGIVSPALFSDGMFMDGLFYATIANNLANGIGSFWELKLTETLMPLFREHPPLAIGLQSIFFSIFGDSIYVERIYSLSTYLITALVVVLIWKESMQVSYHSIAWLPLFFWMCIPLVTWAAANNMLENTMMIFTSLAVLFMLKGDSIKYSFFAGIMLFLAFLCKGFTSLFPLATFFWMWVVNFNQKLDFRSMLIKTFRLLLFLLLPFLFLFIFVPKGIESLWSYFNIQVANSLKNIQTVDTRFFIVIRLLKELIPCILLLGVFVLISKKRRSNFFSGVKSNRFLFFLFLGLSGVLPIMFSMKQSGFYMLATFPFFAIALAGLIAEDIKLWFDKINRNSKGFVFFKNLSLVLICISLLIAFSQKGRVGRDKDLLSDIDKIIEIVPEGTIISMQEELLTNWSLHGYFFRKARISLDAGSASKHEFFLQQKSILFTANEYEKLPLELKKFDLYRKRQP